jgi:bacteriocin-like protein
MRELSTNELDSVIGGSVSYPGVYIQELSGNLTSIPGVSTTGQQISVYQNKAPFHHKVLFL